MRYDAARAAAQAGDGWHAVAVGWLIDEFETWLGLKDHKAMLAALKRWREDPAFAPIRDSTTRSDGAKRLWFAVDAKIKKLSE